VYNIDGNFIHTEVVDHCRRVLLRYLTEHEEGATVATFRDLVDGNRKICLLLINQYDGEGVTVRNGDYRYITRKGTAWLEADKA
jgi:selenocysteine-specific elongation factor